jgi:hypothetical protein
MYYVQSSQEQVQVKSKCSFMVDSGPVVARHCSPDDTLRQFQFFLHCDSMDGDITCVGTRPSAWDLAAVAKDLSNCVAFNTLGYLKHSIRWPLVQPPCFASSADTEQGLWIRKTASANTLTLPPGLPRVRLVCNWCGPADAAAWGARFVPREAGYALTADPAAYDLCVVINKTTEPLDPARTLVIQGEPWVHDDTKPWGVKTWDAWASPPVPPFLAVHGRCTAHVPNVATWQLPQTHDDLQALVNVPKTRGRCVACVTSSKRWDAGHTLRLDFLRFLETDGRVPTAIYGSCEDQGFATYAGPAAANVDKDKALLPYKYYFMAENCAEPGFITEKLWEPLLTETLCFYWGAPDVGTYVPIGSYVWLPLDQPGGFNAAADIMATAVAEDWHTARLPAIRAARETVLSTYSMHAVIKRALRTLRHKALPDTSADTAALCALAGAPSTLVVTAAHKAHWFDEFTVLHRTVDLVQLAAMPAGARAAVTCVVAMEHPEVALEALALLPNATRAVVWNTEQMTRPHARYNFAVGWSRVLSAVPDRVTLSVWDYSAFNARVLEGMVGEPVAVVPSASDRDVQALRQLRRDTPTQYEYVCVGTASPRRHQVVTALAAAGHKVLLLTEVRAADRDKHIASARVLLNVHYDSNCRVYESVRCSRWLRAGMRVVTEPCVDDDAWRAAGAELLV